MEEEDNMRSGRQDKWKRERVKIGGVEDPDQGGSRTRK